MVGKINIQHTQKCKGEFCPRRTSNRKGFCQRCLNKLDQKKAAELEEYQRKAAARVKARAEKKPHIRTRRVP